MKSKRPESTEKKIEASELDWWRQFAQLEYHFAWVQPSNIRNIIRGRYIKKILKVSGKNSKILELGCGMGWLSMELAKHGATNITGVDFSAAQIDLANVCAKSLRLDDKVKFICSDGKNKNLIGKKYDCVVIHAFLHHLDQSEIAEVFNTIKKIIRPSGLLILFEPISFEKPGCNKFSLLFDLQLQLKNLASRGTRWGIRKFSRDELQWRDLLSKRSWGMPPHGPSPKEMPFKEGELEQFIEKDFTLQSKKSYLVISHLVMQEWLLRKISHPISTEAIILVIARLTSWIDSLLSKAQNLPHGQWVFKLLICKSNNT